MSNDVAVRNIKAILNKEECLQALQAACASNIQPKRLVKTVESLVRKTPELQTCSASSIYGAVLECATLGLEPILGRAYFVPFNNRKTGEKELQLIIGYQGLIELGRKGGIEAKANAVFENDEFVWESGFEEKLIHKPCLDTEHCEKTLQFVYCVWKFNGEKHVEVMSKREVDKIRNGSKCGKFGPWADFYVEMAKKTVVRRAAKYWPLTIETKDALERDDERNFSDVVQYENGGVVELKNKLGLTPPPSQPDGDPVETTEGQGQQKSLFLE